MRKLSLSILAALLFICFNKIALASTYDDFNDGSLDLNKWNLGANASLISENNGTLNIDWNGSPSAKQIASLRSKTWFGGDFDISLKYNSLSMDKDYSSTNYNPSHFTLQLQDRSVPMDPPTFSYIYRGTGWGVQQPDVYYSNYYENGIWQGEDAYHTTNDTSGYLRITRTGSTIDTYHADSSKQWVDLDTYNNAFTGPADITLNTVIENNVDSFHVKWDSIDVQSQTAMPPQSTPPALPPAEPIREKNSTSGLINLNNYSIDSNKPSIILVHGRQGSSQDWPTSMSLSLKDRLNESNYNILAWDWKDAANYPTYVGQDLANLYSNAMMQGNKLAVELINRNLISSDLHLIGHSAGGALVGETAGTLGRLGFDKVEQLTFLDPLDAGDTLNGSNGVWADNYYSLLVDNPPLFVGSPVRNTYNDFLGLNTHNYPIEWYDNTITDSSKREGFFWSKEGGGWNQRPSPQTNGGNIIAAKLKETFDSIGNWVSSGYVYLANGIAFLKESSPVFLFEDISIPTDTNYLSFDFQFINLGDGDLLKLYFDDQSLFAFEGTYFSGNDFINSGMIDISQFSGRSGRLIFALDNYGEANSEIAVDNLQFYQVSPVPEPSTCFLLLTGLLATLGLKRKCIK